MPNIRTKRRWWSIVRGAALGILIAVALVVIIDRSRGRTATSAFEYARNAQATAAAFAAAPFAQAPDLERAVAILIAAETQRRDDDPGQSPAGERSDHWEDAVRVCVDFLRACSTGRAEAFAEWARAQHKQLPPRLPGWGPYTDAFYAERYKQVVGRRMFTGITPTEYFRDYFEAYWSRGGGELQPDALAFDPRAIEVRTEAFTHWGDYIGGGSRRDGLGDTFWIGGITIGGMMLWWPESVVQQRPLFLAEQSGVPSPSILDIQKSLFESDIRAFGSIDAARVMLVYRSKTGLNVPMQFFLTRRPRDGVWQLIGLHLNNVGSEVGVGSVTVAPPVY